MGTEVENWDEDGDFQGDLFSKSVSTVQTSFSSRQSVHSESNAAEEDWNLVISPDDETSTANAITNAKLAGVPIPQNVPQSALLGGSIKRLGKKKSRPKMDVDDDWGNDLQLPALGAGQLKLKSPQTPAMSIDDDDEFADLEGSLGIRYAGTKRDDRARSSSVSMMSPSMGSVKTAESEDDDLGGIELPNEGLDFNARLKRRFNGEPVHTPDTSPMPPTSAPRGQIHQLQSSPSLSRQASESSQPPTKVQHMEVEENYDDLDFGGDNVLDPRKLTTVNRNIKVQTTKSQAAGPKTSTTLTFTDKPTVSRIPRPLQPPPKTRLDPVYESGSTQQSRIPSRPGPTTTSAQLLRAKRSAPVLRSAYNATKAPAVPFLPAGISNSQSQHAASKSTSSGHLRRDSDPNRAQSPGFRPSSRLDTPSRIGHRRDVAPASLAREAASKRLFTAPKKKQKFGEGNELDAFDDLPTSATKEAKFTKQPIQRGPPKLRTQGSAGRLSERTTTPSLPPPTPSTVTTSYARSPTRAANNTPRFARDTAASRIAREERLAGTRSRAEGPIMPVQTNWKAQVAARSPANSPTLPRGRPRGTGQKPMLIKQMSTPIMKNEKGMTYNPVLQRWEGNESVLSTFDHHTMPHYAQPQPRHALHPLAQTHHAVNNHMQHGHSHSNPTNLISPPTPMQIDSRPQGSPPRAPALISHISGTRGVQVERGMVFDPRRMCWLKLGPGAGANGDPLSPSATEDEEDPFAGIDDIPDEKSPAPPGARDSSGPGFGASSTGAGTENMQALVVGEEFDLGPDFIRRQREEEGNWRRRVEGWMIDSDVLGEGWRWDIREMVAGVSAMSPM